MRNDSNEIHIIKIQQQWSVSELHVCVCVWNYPGNDQSNISLINLYSAQTWQSQYPSLALKHTHSHRIFNINCCFCCCYCVNIFTADFTKSFHRIGTECYDWRQPNTGFHEVRAAESVQNDIIHTGRRWKRNRTNVIKLSNVNVKESANEQVIRSRRRPLLPPPIPNLFVYVISKSLNAL